MYASLFNAYEHHIRIVKTLAAAKSGLTKDVLLQKSGIASGGSSSNIFKELEDSDFITYMPPFGKRKNGGKFRLIDEYSTFYLKWIDNMPHFDISGTDKEYWQKKQGSAAWHSWSGLAFESICLKHVENIKKALGIAGVTTRESCWFTKPFNKASDGGAQVDLVIDRADGCINLCEIKFHNTKLKIDKSFVTNQRNKTEQFRLTTKTKKSIFTTLISTFGAAENHHFHEVIDNQLTMDDLF